MKLTWRSLGLIGLLGGLGGGINGWLSHAGIPVRAMSPISFGGSPRALDFSSESIISAGFVHGMLLSIVPVGIAVMLWKNDYQRIY